MLCRTRSTTGPQLREKEVEWNATHEGIAIIINNHGVKCAGPSSCEVSRFGRNILVQQGLVEALDARHPHIVMRRSPQPGMEQFAPATECNFNHVLDSAEVTLMGVRRNYTFIIDETGNV